jgi:hypothetical protein
MPAAPGHVKLVPDATANLRRGGGVWLGRPDWNTDG